MRSWIRKRRSYLFLWIDKRGISVWKSSKSDGEIDIEKTVRKPEGI